MRDHNMSISKGKSVYEETYKKGVTYDQDALIKIMQEHETEAHVQKIGNMDSGVEYIQVKIFIGDKKQQHASNSNGEE